MKPHVVTGTVGLEGEFSELPLNRVSRKFILSAVSLSAPNPIPCQSTQITHPLSEEHHILM
jgi:hypothetical protein